MQSPPHPPDPTHHPSRSGCCHQVVVAKELNRNTSEYIGYRVGMRGAQSPITCEHASKQNIASIASSLPEIGHGPPCQVLPQEASGLWVQPLCGPIGRHGQLHKAPRATKRPEPLCHTHTKRPERPSCATQSLSPDLDALLPHKTLMLSDVAMQFGNNSVSQVKLLNYLKFAMQFGISSQAMRFGISSQAMRFRTHMFNLMCCYWMVGLS